MIRQSKLCSYLRCLLIPPALLLLFSSQTLAQVRDIFAVGPRLEDRGETIYTNSFAAIIGINRYKLRQLHLRYAVNDADAVEKELLELGFPRENVFKLLDDKATKAAIVELLGDTLRVKTTPHDRVFIFFAGHGQDVKTPAGDELGYLVPWEGDPGRRAVTMIPMTEIRHLLREIPAKHVLLAVDACYSGHLASRAAPDDQVQEARRLARSRLRLLITAGEKDQQAEEEGGHGVFTRKLIDGLRGGALEGRRLLTGKGLGDYVYRAVAAATSSRQTPFVGVIEGVGDFVLAIPREAAGPPPVPPGPGVGVPARDPTAELLARADGFMARQALTTPPGANAYEALQEVLRQNPTHPGALERLRKMADTYKGWARGALDRGQRDVARRYVESAKKVLPEDPDVAELEARLEAEGRKAAEAAKAGAERRRLEERRESEEMARREGERRRVEEERRRAEEEQARVGELPKIFFEQDFYARYRGEGRVTITASDGREPSLELDDFRHGVFTYYLLEALRGKADKNLDGAVELEEVWQHVRQRVTDEAQTRGIKQRPNLIGKMTAGFLVSLNPGVLERRRLEAGREARLGRQQELRRPDVKPKAGKEFGLGERYALIVGIGKHKDRRIPPPKYAVNDARAMYEVLTDPRHGRFSKDKVRLLLDEEATGDGIKKGFTWLRRNAKEEDTVVIFYSGHGAPEEEETYWVSFDANIGYLSTTAVSNAYIVEALHNIRAKRLITFLDSMYSVF